ncbi:MAG: alpha-amylase family glycosyl hydrolase [Candidatus Sumerlaeota bacterium]
MSIMASPINMSLDGDWKFRRDPQDVGAHENWERADLDDSTWEAIKVPGDWGDGIDGVGWYRKKVSIPKEAIESDSLVLLFGSADDKAEVFLNGKSAVKNRSYSTPFHVDPRPFAAADGSLQITVRVVDGGGGGGLLGSVSIRSAESPEDLYKTALYDKKIPHTLADRGDIVLYSVYTRNFTPEGTFRALQARLPELKALGANTLWLLPIHEIGVEKRKGPDGSPYAIKDYYSIDPNLGTKDDFKALVQATHDQGMKIIIDCVLNHTSPDSAWATEHPDWFERDANGKPIPAVADWSDVVDLDWKNKTVWAEATKMMEYWVRDFDIDGYRCDVADMVPDGFWAQVRTKLDAIKPGIVMLAESNNSNHQLNGFDIVYCDGIRDVMKDIVDGKANANDMREEIYSEIYSNPKNATRMLFVENHDKPRVVNFLKSQEQVKALAMLTATLPGVPLLYSGTEIGASADRDATFFTKTAVDWSHPDTKYREIWTTLLAIRNQEPALQSGEIKILDVEPRDQVLVYERSLNGETATVALNLSDKAVEIKPKQPNPAIPSSLPAWGGKVILP